MLNFSRADFWDEIDVPLIVGPVALWTYMHYRLHLLSTSQSSSQSFFNGLGAATPSVPSAVDDMLRVTTYGFSFKDWRADFPRLATHMLVHWNERHLSSNCITHMLVALRYRRPKFLRRSSSPFRRWYGTLLAIAVMFGGGLCGLVAMREAFSKESANFGKENSFGFEWLATVLTSAHTTLKNQRTIICGASAAIMSLAGFNVVTQHDLLGAALVIVPDICAAAGFDVLKSVADHTGGGNSGGGSGGGVQVGHSAHIGGFLFGATVGMLLLNVG